MTTLLRLAAISALIPGSIVYFKQGSFVIENGTMPDDTAIEAKASELEAQKIQADALSVWKTQRGILVEAIEVTYSSTTYQGDEVSQTRMSRSIAALPDDTTTVPWTAKDNTVHQLTKPDLKAILIDAGTQQSVLWNDGRPS